VAGIWCSRSRLVPVGLRPPSTNLGGNYVDFSPCGRYVIVQKGEKLPFYLVDLKNKTFQEKDFNLKNVTARGFRVIALKKPINDCWLVYLYSFSEFSTDFISINLYDHKRKRMVKKIVEPGMPPERSSRSPSGFWYLPETIKIGGSKIFVVYDEFVNVMIFDFKDYISSVQ